MCFWRPHQSGPVFFNSGRRDAEGSSNTAAQAKPLCRICPLSAESPGTDLLAWLLQQIDFAQGESPSTGAGAEPGITRPGNVLRGTEGGWRRERGLLDCEAICQTCERSLFSFFFTFFPLDSQTATIYQRMKEIDYKRNIQSTRRWGWSHCRHSKHARTPWFSTT